MLRFFLLDQVVAAQVVDLRTFGKVVCVVNAKHTKGFIDEDAARDGIDGAPKEAID